MSENRALILPSLAVGLCVGGLFYCFAQLSSGTGSSAGVGTSSPPHLTGERKDLTLHAPGPPDPGPRASARFSTTPGPSAHQTSPDEAGEDFAGLDLRSLLDLDVGVQPTAEGLFARTTEMWAQPEFLALTAAEARELLPLDDELATAPGSLLDLVGPLPTAEECERAFQDPSVQALLAAACAAELQLYALELALNPAFDGAIDVQRRVFEADEYDLMLQLDRVSGFKGWSLMHRAFREFSK